MEVDKKEYAEYVKQVTPTNKKGINLLWAFLVGGIICTIGQFLTNLYMGMGMDQETAAAWTTLSLIGGSVILTGLNIYPKIVKFGGAGALVPITGFANAVVSPALEFKSEGFITGTAAKMFIIAGPVIVFGTCASIIYGLILCLAH